MLCFGLVPFTVKKKYCRRVPERPLQLHSVTLEADSVQTVKAGGLSLIIRLTALKTEENG